jgi:CDP-glucose 4,6-dehydratase
VGKWQGAVEDLVLKEAWWRGRRVFLTGHTGFKGGWLAMWLARLGARVYGYALDPPSLPNLFAAADVAGDLAGDTRADVRDERALCDALCAAAPEIVLHLAAQPLVRQSYADPVATYAINVLGTVHLLEAARKCPSVRAIVNVTTDKCYENREWIWGYRESEPLGGVDPYSSSKACAELVSAAYRESFFKQGQLSLATARAGNVIGGGDWSADRLVPDFLRAADAGAPVVVRHPQATRPWQHVLEPLHGYLLLAQQLHERGGQFAGAWNFGPRSEDSCTVGEVLDRMVRLVPGTSWERASGTQPHEAHTLQLDSAKARAALSWSPRWSLTQALEQTLRWHAAWRSGADMHAFSVAQIADYERAADRA